MRHRAFPFLEELFLHPEAVDPDRDRAFGLAMPPGEYSAEDVALALEEDFVLSWSQSLLSPLVPRYLQYSETHFIFLLLEDDSAVMGHTGGAKPSIERAAEKVFLLEVHEALQEILGFDMLLALRPPLLECSSTK
jgi:hypothetical protein